MILKKKCITFSQYIAFKFHIFSKHKSDTNELIRNDNTMEHENNTINDNNNSSNRNNRRKCDYQNNSPQIKPQMNLFT